MKADTSAGVFDALGDPTRRAILQRLRDEGPLAAGELASAFAVSRPAVSQHLAVLRDSRLVTVRPEGTRRLYSLDPYGLTALRVWVEAFWSVVLTDYADEVRRRTAAPTPPRPSGGADRETQQPPTRQRRTRDTQPRRRKAET